MAANRYGHPDALKQAVAALWADGLSATVIAAQIGTEFGRPLSRNAVIGILDRAKLLGDPNRQRKTAQRARRTPRAAMSGPPTPQPVAIESRPVALLERRGNQCAWPLWPHEETGAPDFMVCGAERFGEAPYCEGHAAMARPGHAGHAWKPGDPRKRHFGPVVCGVWAPLPKEDAA